MAGANATETGNGVSQPTLEFTSLLITQHYDLKGGLEPREALCREKFLSSAREDIIQVEGTHLTSKGRGDIRESLDHTMFED